MGLVSSRQRELRESLVDGGAVYNFPGDRQKKRRSRNYPTDSDGVQFDPTCDKYDFLLVFPRPDDDESEAEGDRISWCQIETLWFQAIPGDEDRKTAGIEWLRQEWVSRFRTDTVSSAEGGDTVPLTALQGLVREHVVDRLTKAGLQLELTLAQDGSKVFCRVRAPMALLERKADELNHKLKFRGEVDPGPEFWRKSADQDAEGKPIFCEIVEESILYEKNQAAPTPTDEPPAPAPAPALPPPGSRITVRFSDGIDYGGTITELVDEHHARVLYDDGQSETVRFPDPDVRVLRAAPAAATPAAAAGGPIRVRTAGGREAIVLEKMQRGWFRVELDGNANDEGGANERKSLRRPQLAVGQDHLLDAAPQAPAARPAPAPTDEAAPAPALGDKDAQQVAALEKLHESLKDKPNLIVCRKPLEDFGFRCGATDQQQNRFDALPPQSLHSIEDILGGQYAQTYSLNSVPKLIAYLEGVLNRLSGGRLFPSPSAPKKKRGYEAPAPKITERARPRWSSEEERRLRELVAELGETRWPAIAMRLGTGRTGAAVELRWATLRQKSHGRPPRAAAEAAPATDGRERVRTAGGRVATIIERRSRGWLFVELDGVANDEGGAHERKSIRATTTTALHGAATRKRPGTGGAAPRPAQRPRLVSRGGNDDDDKDARIAELEAALAQAQQAPVAPVAPPAAALASVTGRLRELASLRASGALTEAQFERAKNTELGLQ